MEVPNSKKTQKERANVAHNVILAVKWRDKLKGYRIQMVRPKPSKN